MIASPPAICATPTPQKHLRRTITLTAVPFHVAQDLLEALMRINRAQPQGGVTRAC
jgi:hypothetical protein